jgi:DNA repair exonuclease SbcCD ATPase subunit
MEEAMEEVRAQPRLAGAPHVDAVSLPQALRRLRQVTGVAEAAALRELEVLEAERQRLGDWQRRLEECTKAEASHAARERERLEADQEAFRDTLEEVQRREIAVKKKEADAARREKALLEAEAFIAGQRQGVEESLAKLKERVSALREEREAFDSRQKAHEDEVAALKKRALEAEESLATAKQEEDALKERVRVAEEALAAERNLQHSGARRIADWASEASLALVPFGFAPIQVEAPPSSVADALPVLDSATERLGHLGEVLSARLEAEGQELSRVVAEHILVCLRSHDPTISLAPIVEGPVPETEEAAREGVQEVVDAVAARFVRTPEE